MHAPRHRRLQRGVTLVEALVAFFVMALGMLAAVGTQLSLRLNSDVAKQRSEAVRLAQNDLDAARAFTTVRVTAGARSFEDIASTEVPVALQPAGANASYLFNRSVPANDAFPYRSVTAQITWEDRKGTLHPVRLDTIVAGMSPALSGYLSLTPDGKPTSVGSRTNSRLPPWIRDLKDGRGVFKPPGSDTMAWIFDNRSGFITARCIVPSGSTTDSIVAADLTACTALTIAGRLVSGYVWFSLQAPPNADAPDGTAFELHPIFVPGTSNPPTSECFDDALAVRSPTRIEYYCAVYPAQAGGAWSGYLTLGPTDLWRADSATYTLCRYSADLDGSNTITNGEHPLDYVDVTSNLLNQNFLVILRSQTCPLGSGVNRTAQHDPRPQ